MSRIEIFARLYLIVTPANNACALWKWKHSRALNFGVFVGKKRYVLEAN